MPTTPDRGYPYPPEFTDPWYIPFEDFAASIGSDVQNLYDQVDFVHASIGTVGSPGELRQTRGFANAIAFVKGFTTVNDSGGGLFLWIEGSTTDDGGTRIVPTGTPTGYWLRLFDGATYHAKWFGLDSAAADNAPILNGIFSSIGTAAATVVIQPDKGATATIYLVSQDVTVPEHLTLVIEPGARLSIDAGNTVTIEAPERFVAGCHQIFCGAGDATFVGGGTGRARWWPCPNNIQLAVNSGLSRVLLDDGVYEPNEPIVVPSHVAIYGTLVPHVDTVGVVIRPTAAVSTAFLLDGVYDPDFCNFKIDMVNMTPELTYIASTISFSNTYGTDRYCQISDSANGLGSWASGMSVGVEGSTANNRTYVVESMTAGVLTCKGPMTAEGAGPSITLRAGPYGMRLKGTQRGLFQNIRIDANESKDGTIAWYLTNQSPAGFATYYNRFVGCNARNINTGAKHGIGMCAHGIPVSTVTNNTWETSPMQAWGTDWFFTHTGSGFSLLNCNAEQPGEWGLYVNDVIAQDDRAIKVWGGEIDSAYAAEWGSLVLYQSTVHNELGDYVLFHRHDRTLNLPNQHYAKYTHADQGVTAGSYTTFTIKDLVDKIGSAQGTIYLLADDPDGQPTVYTIGTDLTIPANITLDIQRGAQLDVSATITLTIQGFVRADPVQIFTGSGDVAFSGGIGSADWFDEINTAVNSGLRLVHLLDDYYTPTETINIPLNVRMEGVSARDGGSTGTVIRPTSAVHKGILIDGTQYITVKHLQLNMQDLTPELTFGPATTVSFATAVDGGTISDSASGFGSFTEGMSIGVSGSTGGLNDSTYMVESATASTLVVKGVALTDQTAGASITIKAGPVGVHVKGLKRGLFESVRVWTNATDHGTAGWLVTPRDSSAFASYYNNWGSCSAKSEGGQYKGVGFFASALDPGGAVTNNMFHICSSQAWGLGWMMCGTGSGFQLVACNGESAGQWGIYVSDVPSATTTAVKVLNGEWSSADAGEPDALLMKDTTINGTVGDNVTTINFGTVQNNRVRADFFVGEEKPYSYADGATISPDSMFMYISGATGPITLDTTTPIAAGYRGQLLCLVGGHATNHVTLVNSGNVVLQQDGWYGQINARLFLFYSQSAGSKWLELCRSEGQPLVIRTAHNAFYRFRTEETELTLSGTSVEWTDIIPPGCEVIGVTSIITETITGASGYQIGTSFDADRWANENVTAAGSKTDMANFAFTDRDVYQTTYSIFVASKVSAFTGGKIRLALFYLDLAAPDD